MTKNYFIILKKYKIYVDITQKLNFSLYEILIKLFRLK